MTTAPRPAGRPGHHNGKPPFACPTPGCADPKHYTNGLCYGCAARKRNRERYALRRVEVRPPCAHCAARMSERRCGLCRVCFRDPAIRGVFDLDGLAAHGRRGVEDFCGPGDPPPTATDAPPGSERKLLVMAERAASKMQLHHPADAGSWEGVAALLDRLATAVVDRANGVDGGG